MVEAWVIEENLRPFLEAVSVYADYGFDEDDWNAMRYGLLRPDLDPKQPEVHLDYPLLGKRAVDLHLSFEPGSSVVAFRLHADPDLEARADAMAFLAATYLLSRAHLSSTGRPLQ